MELDTSDLSDEEEVENVDEVERKNQIFTDCPAADDEDIESSQPAKLTMPRDRFHSLLTSLHFVNNLTMPESKKKDKLWKLRLWLDSFREKCLQVVREEHNSVDEMMIQMTKVKFSGIKQNMRGKPHPWGFKLWLASTLPEGLNYKVYADNYFTCVPVVDQLLDLGIHYVETVRQVLLPNCNLEDEKILKSKGRGSFDIRVEANHHGSLVSSFAGTEPVQKIQRWNKATKSYIEVERPYIVSAYSKYLAKYKFPMIMRRWYIYIFWHTIILAVINSSTNDKHSHYHTKERATTFSHEDSERTLQTLQKRMFEYALQEVQSLSAYQRKGTAFGTTIAKVCVDEPAAPAQSVESLHITSRPATRRALGLAAAHSGRAL
ncbi:unnamed protein product [Leuciscus chuanchicus]